jgi:hypothetical protein
MGSRIPAPIDGALRAAVAWVSDFRRRKADADLGAARVWHGALLCAVILVSVARLGLSGIARLLQGRWAIGAIGLAVALPFGVFEYHYHDWQKAMNEPKARGYAASAPLEEGGIAPAGRKTNESTEENARLGEWKRSVEEAVKKAEVREQSRQQDGVKAQEGDGVTKRKDLRPQQGDAPPIDLGIAQEVEKPQAEAAKERNEAKNTSEAIEANETKLTKETKAIDLSANSPAIDGRETGSMTGPTDAIPLGRREEPPSRNIGRHSWERGRWRGRHYRWAFYRLTGVARAFPYVWYLAR